MPEHLTAAERSRVMAAVKSRNTSPELIVRRIVHGLGYRFRLHRRDLPGTPDVVLVRLGKVINVHGCFWHMHTCQRRRKAPVNHAEYWQRKRERNAARDKRSIRGLKRQGWEVLTVWECQTRNVEALKCRLAAFLSRAAEHPNQ